MSISVKPSADPLSHASMTSYCKFLMSYVQACHQQIKAAFLDPNSKNPVGPILEPDDRVFWKHHQRETVLRPLRKGYYQVLLTT